MPSSLSNLQLADELETVRAALDGVSVLALFTSETDPAPGLNLGDFVEASYPGYARFDLAGGWDPSPVKESEGVYRVRSGVASFDPPTEGETTIQGVLLLVEEDQLAGAVRFPVPVVLATGGEPLLLRLIRRNLAQCP